MKINKASVASQVEKVVQVIKELKKDQRTPEVDKASFNPKGYINMPPLRLSIILSLATMICTGETRPTPGQANFTCTYGGVIMMARDNAFNIELRPFEFENSSEFPINVTQWEECVLRAREQQLLKHAPVTMMACRMANPSQPVQQCLLKPQWKKDAQREFIEEHKMHIVSVLEQFPGTKREGLVLMTSFYFIAIINVWLVLCSIWMTYEAIRNPPIWSKYRFTSSRQLGQQFNSKTTAVLIGLIVAYCLAQTCACNIDTT